MEVLTSTSELATAVENLARLVLEPSCLSQVYEGQSDSSDREIAKLVILPQGSKSIYSIQLVDRLELVYRHTKSNLYQLVILRSRGLCSLLP